MKFIIKHEIKGRIRISLARKFHTVREADVLEQYLLGLDGVTAAKVYERTADAVIYYKEDREAVLASMVRLPKNRRWQLLRTRPESGVQRKTDSEGTDALCDEDISPGAGPCGIHVRAGDPLYRERYPLPRI